MPDNGNGTFVRLFSWVADAAAGVNISAVEFDQDGTDVAGALTNRICRDGQSSPTANIAWANKRITALGDPVDPQDAVNLRTAQSFAPDGQCYFASTSGTVCTLTPLNGGALWINGAQQIVPAGGVTLSSTGGVSGGGNVAASTRYYVYAYMNSATPSVMALEASTTGYTVDATGRANKTGDTTRRLVGMVYPGAGTPGVFTDTGTYNGVASYFNRRGKVLAVTANGTTASTTASAISSTLLQFLAWSDEIVSIGAKGWASFAATGGASGNFVEVYLDGIADSVAQYSQSYTTNAYSPLGYGMSRSLTEGPHSHQIYIASGGGGSTLTVQGRYTVATRN